MILAVSQMLAAATAACSPVPGADAVLARAQTRWLILGEMHGTAEMPRALTDLACAAAAQRRPVVVAVEQTVDNQPLLDAFLASNGKPAARAAFLRAPMWHTKFKDGRSSTAMLAMFERLRAMRQAGQIARVVAFDPVVSSGSADRNARMAANLVRVDPGVRGIVLTLVGGLHAQKSMLTFGGQTYPAAASLLPGDRTVSLMMIGDAGTAWVCYDTCGAQPIGSARTQTRGIRMQRDAGVPFDGIFDLGETTTSSPPVVAAD
ncbi:hypothetical protein [Sphingomonas sp.]|uniref:hypothetical protein n=1 Tax=Sphingomonas sp. TaxID=28214 RepID=UPI0035BBC20D